MLLTGVPQGDIRAAFDRIGSMIQCIDDLIQTLKNRVSEIVRGVGMVQNATELLDHMTWQFARLEEGVGSRRRRRMSANMSSFDRVAENVEDAIDVSVE